MEKIQMTLEEMEKLNKGKQKLIDAIQSTDYSAWLFIGVKHIDFSNAGTNRQVLFESRSDANTLIAEDNK